MQNEDQNKSGQEVLGDVSTETTVDGTTGVEVGDVVEPVSSTEVEYSTEQQTAIDEFNANHGEGVLALTESSESTVESGDSVEVVSVSDSGDIPEGTEVLESVTVAEGSDFAVEGALYPNEEVTAYETSTDVVTEEVLEEHQPTAEELAAHQEAIENAQKEKINAMTTEFRKIMESGDMTVINWLATNVANVILRFTSFPQNVANSVQNALVYANHQQHGSEMTNIIISREALDGANLRVQYQGRSANEIDGFCGEIFSVFGAANENETTVSTFSHQVELTPLVKAHLVKQFQLYQAMEGDVFSAYFSVSALHPRKALHRMAEDKVPAAVVTEVAELIH